MAPSSTQSFKNIVFLPSSFVIVRPRQSRFILNLFTQTHYNTLKQLQYVRAWLIQALPLIFSLNHDFKLFFWVSTLAKKTQLLVICLDAMEPVLLEEWASSGDMPVLGSLMARGARGRVLNYPGFGNGAYWPSFYTGVNPGRHGRYFRKIAQPGTYDLHLYNEDTDLDVVPFWKLLSQAGKKVGVIDVMKAPLVKEINGIDVADWMVHARAMPARSWPPELIADVFEKYGDDPFNGQSDARNRSFAEFEDLLSKILTRVETKTRMASEYLSASNWDMYLVSFADAHDIGHTSWHLHDPTHSMHDPEFVRSVGDPVKKVYVALDTAIGKLLEVAGPDVKVVVFTGPGIETNDNANHLLDEILRRIEGLPPREAKQKTSPVRALARKFLPSGLRGVLTKTAGATGVNLSGEQSKRKFYLVPNNENAGAVRINLVGREPQGQVQPGAEFDAVCESLTTELMAIVNAETGEPLVKEVVRISDICHGEHVGQGLPDLYVVWRRTGHNPVAKSAKIGEIHRPYLGMRTGDHTGHGTLIAQGPGIAAGAISEGYLVTSVAPTIMALLGVEMKDADGSPIHEVCGAVAET